MKIFDEKIFLVDCFLVFGFVGSFLQRYISTDISFFISIFFFDSADLTVIRKIDHLTRSRINPINAFSSQNIPWTIVDRYFDLFSFRYSWKNNASIERRDKMHEFRVFLFSFPPLVLHPVIPLRGGGGTLFIVFQSSIFYLRVILASGRRAAVHPVKISLGKLNGFTSRMEVPNKVFLAYWKLDFSEVPLSSLSLSLSRIRARFSFHLSFCLSNLLIVTTVVAMVVVAATATAAAAKT